MHHIFNHIHTHTHTKWTISIHFVQLSFVLKDSMLCALPANRPLVVRVSVFYLDVWYTFDTSSRTGGQESLVSSQGVGLLARWYKSQWPQRQASRCLTIHAPSWHVFKIHVMFIVSRFWKEHLLNSQMFCMKATYLTILLLLYLTLAETVVPGLGCCRLG